MHARSPTGRAIAARQAASKRAGKVRGRAVGYYIEHAGIFNERMDLRFDPGGTLTIVAGTHSHGQGHATTFAQLVSEWLGVPFESIRYVQGDTDKVPFGRGTYAARSAVLGGCALRIAADAIIEKGKAMAAQLLEAVGGRHRLRGGALSRARDRQADPVGRSREGVLSAVRDAAGRRAWASKAAAPSTATFRATPTAATSAKSSSIRRPAQVTIDRYAVVDDCGRAINPMICEGQIHGGIAQGIGQALMENVVYDRDSGQLLSGSYMDYAHAARRRHGRR